MIDFIKISNDKLDEQIKRLDEKISYVNTEFNLELKGYGIIIRIALNAIQIETIENLIERVLINKELERGLDNVGGYTLDYLGENNPKSALIEILGYLKENLPKRGVLVDHLNKTKKKTIVVADNNDFDYLKRQIKNYLVTIISHSDQKKLDVQNKTMVFYSFNGQKDFDYLYNLHSGVLLILYNEERNLYNKYTNQRKRLIEDEIRSRDRFKICDIEYAGISDRLENISAIINSVISRIDDMNGKAYEGYKNECDLLLNELEEKLIYKLLSDRGTFFLECNDTIFNKNGDLIKAFKINIGDEIRVYPKVQLAENLYQIATETEPEVFGRVEEHVAFWKHLINELRNEFGDERLYNNLKRNGLKILATTLTTYGKGNRKFPMFNNDLRAIFRLYYKDKSDQEIDLILKPVLKSKTTYNSTMIVLGRGVKNELHLFLKEKKIGEILEKRNFNTNTLQVFVDEYMPIHRIISKEVFNESIENLEAGFLQQIEL